jgi:ankyrin repeat protein
MGSIHSHPRFVSWAAQDGRVEDLVYHLQKAGKNSLKPSALSPKQRAPIHLAAIGGHSECVKVLFDAGSPLEVTDKEGHTALHLAVSNQHYRTVQVLLSLGAKPNSKTRFNVTPLHLATSVGNTPCVELLLSHGALINCQESWGQTPLAIATLQGRLVTMGALLSHGADSGWLGKTPLCIAMLYSLSLEIRDYQHEQTPLHIACASKDEDRVLVLLDAGCDVQAADGQSHSPLGVALLNRFYRAVPLLVEYGARLNDTERAAAGLPLLNHLDNLTTGTPLSLSHQCRVVVRQSIGPTNLANSDLSTLNLPPQVLAYLHAILEVCEESGEVKRRAVEGVTVVRPMMVDR